MYFTHPPHPSILYNSTHCPHLITTATRHASARTVNMNPYLLSSPPTHPLHPPILSTHPLHPLTVHYSTNYPNLIRHANLHLPSLYLLFSTDCIKDALYYTADPLSLSITTSSTTRLVSMSCTLDTAPNHSSITHYIHHMWYFSFS